MRVLSIKKVIEGDRKFFTSWKRDLKIIRVFFREVMKIMISGQEVRLPKRGNGTFKLVVKHIGMEGFSKLKHIRSPRINNVFNGTVKPIVSGFNPYRAGRIKYKKELTIRYSYSQEVINKLQTEFADSNKRMLLPEID